MSDQNTPRIDPGLADLEELKEFCLHVVSIIDVLGEFVDSGLRSLAENMPPPPPPDPRPPIQRLLESFDLEEERKMRQSAAAWNDSELRQALKGAAGAAKEFLDEARAGMGTPESPIDSIALGAVDAAARGVGAVEKAAAEPLVVGAEDADVHVSDSAVIFKSWHIPASRLASEDFEQPLRVPITDPEIIANIKAARAMMPVIEQWHGKAERGKLCWTKYPPRGTEGWMFAEPDDSEYGLWLAQKMKAMYAERHDALEHLLAEPGTPQKRIDAARAAKHLAATCIAIKEQEGAPSAINTYDGLVLTWGIGIAGPGKLPETFARITDARKVETRRVAKALYLCGFKYEGTMIGSQFHGGYQIVDLTTEPPCVVFWDNFYHYTDDKNKKQKKFPAKKGEYEGRAFNALKHMVDQVEMLHLLIQLARDPLTREVVFLPNYQMIARFGEITYAEQIQTQALYVFVGEVRHNWAFGMDLVKWAVDHFDEDERKTAVPSVERDRAIAKGIVRYLMCALQKQRWASAIRKLDAHAVAVKKAQKAGKPAPNPPPKMTLAELPAATEYGLTRLINHYWKPMHTGVKTQDASRLEVPDYLTPVPTLESISSYHYGWVEFPPTGSPKSATTKNYDIGRRAQMDLLFENDNIEILGFDDKQNVKIVDNNKPRIVTREGKPLP